MVEVVEVVEMVPAGAWSSPRWPDTIVIIVSGIGAHFGPSCDTLQLSREWSTFCKIGVLKLQLDGMVHIKIRISAKENVHGNNNDTLERDEVDGWWIMQTLYSKFNFLVNAKVFENAIRVKDPLHPRCHWKVYVESSLNWIFGTGVARMCGRVVVVVVIYHSTTCSLFSIMGP